MPFNLEGMLRDLRNDADSVDLFAQRLRVTFGVFVYTFFGTPAETVPNAYSVLFGE